MKSKSFIPAYLFALFMWVLASLPGDDINRIQKFPENLWLRLLLSDPFIHFLIFGLLTSLIFKGFYDEDRRSIPLIKIGLISFGYGLLIEIYQGILSWRSFGLDDLVWNTIGVLFTLLVCCKILQIKTVNGL